MGQNNPSVVVLLASYNGAQYIREQIESVLNQTVPVTLIVRDDGSTDGTVDIVGEYPEVTLLQRAKNDPARGHKANFNALCQYAVEHTQADYYFFADQDDVWLPNKVERLTAELTDIAAQNGTGYPVLVHSDLYVVDEHLNLLAGSFVRFQGLPAPDSIQVPQSLVQNTVTGCASGFNRSLLELATPIPEHAVIHDFWFGLVAKLSGTLGFVSEPLVNYRQHGANSVGATSTGSQKDYRSRYFFQTLLRYPDTFAQVVLQTKALRARLQERAQATPITGKDDLAVLEQFSELEKQSLRSRLRWAPHLLTHNRIDRELYLRGVLCALPWLIRRKSEAKRVPV